MEAPLESPLLSKCIGRPACWQAPQSRRGAGEAGWVAAAAGWVAAVAEREMAAAAGRGKEAAWRAAVA